MPGERFNQYFKAAENPFEKNAIISEIAISLRQKAYEELFKNDYNDKKFQEMSIEIEKMIEPGYLFGYMQKENILGDLNDPHGIEKIRENKENIVNGLAKSIMEKAEENLLKNGLES